MIFISPSCFCCFFSIVEPKSKKEEFKVLFGLNEAQTKKTHDPHFFSSYCKKFTKKALEKFLSNFYTDTSQRRKQEVLDFILHHFQKPYEFLTEGIKYLPLSFTLLTEVNVHLYFIYG
jgi:hypothetical protein